MQAHGTTSEQLGEIAVAQRAWAAGNPVAQLREPLTLAEHQESRWIAEPLHLLDCCLVSNGAIAVVVTAADRATSLARPPVYVWGYGQAHAPRRMQAGSQWGLVTPAARSGPQAMRMAGIGVDDVDVAELYDCYTYTVLVTLEDYGFCAKGEGGEFRRPLVLAAMQYVSAIVELAEGPWLMVRLLVEDPARLRVGDPVRVRYLRSGQGEQEGEEEGEVVPVFEPA